MKLSKSIGLEKMGAEALDVLSIHRFIRFAETDPDRFCADRHRESLNHTRIQGSDRESGSTGESSPILSLISSLTPMIVRLVLSFELFLHKRLG